METKTTETNDKKRDRETQEEDQLAAFNETNVPIDKVDVQQKKHKAESKTITQMRDEKKNERNQAFGFKALINNLNISAEVRNEICESLASDGAADIDVQQVIQHNRKYSLEEANTMDLKSFIQLIQRSQTYVQGSRVTLRSNNSSLPKAVRNFILTTLTIVSKTISQIESDMVKSKQKIQDWNKKTEMMEDAEAEKVKIDISEIDGDFLSTDNSKRAYIGMLNEENRFKTNYIHLSDYFVKAGIIKIVN